MKLNLAGGLAGGASGAATGSMFGPWGTAIGGLGGAALGLFSGGGKKKEKEGKLQQLPLLSKSQQEMLALIKEGVVSGQGPFGELYGKFNPEAFDKGVSQPALKNFQENILPQLQEKFIGGNQLLGSGFRRGALKAGTDLQSELAKLMYQAQEGQKQNQLSGVNSLLGAREFENLYEKPQKSPTSSFLQGAAGALGQSTPDILKTLISSFSTGSSPAAPTQAG